MAEIRDAISHQELKWRVMARVRDVSRKRRPSGPKPWLDN